MSRDFQLRIQLADSQKIKAARGKNKTEWFIIRDSEISIVSTSKYYAIAYA